MHNRGVASLRHGQRVTFGQCGAVPGLSSNLNASTRQQTHTVRQTLINGFSQRFRKPNTVDMLFWDMILGV